MYINCLVALCCMLATCEPLTSSDAVVTGASAPEAESGRRSAPLAQALPRLRHLRARIHPSPLSPSLLRYLPHLDYWIDIIVMTPAVAHAHMISVMTQDAFHFFIHVEREETPCVSLHSSS